MVVVVSPVLNAQIVVARTIPKDKSEKDKVKDYGKGSMKTIFNIDVKNAATNGISQSLIFQIQKCQLKSALFYATICKIILYNRSLNLYEQTSFYPIY